MVNESFSDYLPYRSFLADNLIDLRGAGIMAGYHIKGLSPESSTDLDLANTSRHLTAAIRFLGTQDTIHAIFNRSPVAAPSRNQNATIPLAARLVALDQHRRFDDGEYWQTASTLYLTHHFERAATNWFSNAMFSVGREAQAKHEIATEQALSRFSAFVNAASVALTLVPMTQREMFDDLMGIVPYHEYQAALPSPEMRLNEIIGCEYLVNKMQPKLGDYYLVPLCLTAYPVGDDDEPGRTMPQMLAPLLSHPGLMTLSARFNCRYQYDADQALDAIRRKHSWSQIVQPIQWLKAWAAREGEINDVVIDLINNIKSARNKSAMGWSFGEATVTAIVRDTNLDAARTHADELWRDCQERQITARIEKVNSWEVIAATWPGNRESNARRPIITGANFADLVLPATRWQGAMEAA
jgi:hypothetical protein